MVYVGLLIFFLFATFIGWVLSRGRFGDKALQTAIRGPLGDRSTRSYRRGFVRDKTSGPVDD